MVYSCRVPDPVQAVASLLKAPALVTPTSEGESWWCKQCIPGHFEATSRRVVLRADLAYDYLQFLLHSRSGDWA